MSERLYLVTPDQLDEYAGICHRHGGVLSPEARAFCATLAPDWTPITTPPVVGQVVDLWHPLRGRLADYRWTGEAFEAWTGSWPLVADATHWRERPEGPGRG